MSTELDCPETECWPDLLDESAPAQQRDYYVRHLEWCPACQERLDHAERCADEILLVALRIGDPTSAPTEHVLHRPVPIKVMAPFPASSATARQRLAREARAAAAAVCHDQVVAVHGVSEAAGLCEPGTVAAPSMPAIVADARANPSKGKGIKGSLARSWLIVCLGATALLVWLAFWFCVVGLELAVAENTGESSTQKVYPQEFFQSFKGDSQQWQRWQVLGPDASECVRFEPAGVRFTLPRGFPGSRPYTGLATEIEVIGDFEITVYFEILPHPPAEAAWNQQARLTLDAVLQKPGGINLSRSFERDGKQFFGAWHSLVNAETGKNMEDWKGAPTQAMSGGLRLVRKGTVVSYYVSGESQSDFTLIQECPWSSEPLKEIRLIGSTGSHEGSLDVRVSDFRLRAGALPNLSADATLPSIGNGVVVVILCLGIAIPLLFGAWFWLRQRRTVDSQRQV